MKNPSEMNEAGEMIISLLGRLQFDANDIVNLLQIMAMNYIVQNEHGSKDQAMILIGDMYDNIKDQYEDRIRSKQSAALASESGKTQDTKADNSLSM